MSQSLVRLLAGFLLIVGIGVAGYTISQIPPYQSGGSLDFLAIALLFFGLFCALAGLGSLIALWAHKRWPGLAGNSQSKTNLSTRPNGISALRQGILLSISLCAIFLFSMLHILDSIFVFVVFLFSGLIETYFQNVERRT